MTQNSQEESTNDDTGTKANRRRHLGRRVSDWMFPTVLGGLAILALLWAVDSNNKRKQLENMNKAIAVQAQLLERILKNEEKAKAASEKAAIEKAAIEKSASEKLIGESSRPVAKPDEKVAP